MKQVSDCNIVTTSKRNTWPRRDSRWLRGDVPAPAAAAQAEAAGEGGAAGPGGPGQGRAEDQALLPPGDGHQAHDGRPGEPRR